MDESPQTGSERADNYEGNAGGTERQMIPPTSWEAYGDFAELPRKRKWLAVLLSLFVPGTGHFYLGLMQKGLMIMLLIIMDIFAIVHFSINMSSIPLITLLALFLPIIYFYSLFDALLSTEKVNAFQRREAAGVPYANRDDSRKPVSTPYIGWLLVGTGGLFFVFSAKPDWIGLLMDKIGTLVGGLVLIGIGVVLFLKNSSKPK